MRGFLFLFLPPFLFQDKFTYHVVEEELEAVLPAQPEVAPGEKHGEGVPDDVVGPALLLHLSNPRVDEGKASVARLISPEMLLIVKPGNVDTDGVPLHLSEHRVAGRQGVEELPPDERDVGEGAGRIIVTDFSPGRDESPVVFPNTQTAELDVGREGERLPPSQNVGIITIRTK